MMQWLSHEMVQGLGFNAGSTFDPPREVTDRRFQPDLSLGIGHMPLDKSRFPEPQTPALKELNAARIFPSAVLFPNLTMHWRLGLPGRSDLAIRFADMTTPPGYKISPGTAGKGQSNSIGFGLRRHFFGGDAPLLSLGANYNYVFGRFQFKTKFNVNTVQGFSADNNVDGTIQWSVNSMGLNAVLSQTFGRWTPFMGVGYNYVTGSVRSRLEAVSESPLISPIVGEGSERPEASQARVILGTQMNRSWVHLFANGEVKAIGIGSGKSWIVHAGLTLPFHLGSSKGMLARKAARPPERSAALEPAKRDVERAGPARAEIQPELIFIQ